jgi:hypothetical protein
MWHLVKYDKKRTFLVKMDMGVINWDILSINIYNQLRQDVYIFSKKRQRFSQMRPNGTCTTINFGGKKSHISVHKFVGKSHINR